MPPSEEGPIFSFGGAWLGTVIRLIVAWFVTALGLWLPFTVRDNHAGGGFGDALALWPFLAGYGVFAWLGTSPILGLVAVALLGFLLLSAWSFVSDDRPRSSLWLLATVSQIGRAHV